MGGRGSPQKSPPPPSATILLHPVCEDLRGGGHSPWDPRGRRVRPQSGVGWGPHQRTTRGHRASEGRADSGGGAGRARAMATPTRSGEGPQSGCRAVGREVSGQTQHVLERSSNRKQGRKAGPTGAQMPARSGAAALPRGPWRGGGGTAGRRHDPVRHSRMGELALQAGISPTTHTHPPPPAPHRVPTRQAGGRHPRCTRQVPWVWRAPSREGGI